MATKTASLDMASASLYIIHAVGLREAISLCAADPDDEHAICEFLNRLVGPPNSHESENYLSSEDYDRTGYAAFLTEDGVRNLRLKASEYIAFPPTAKTPSLTNGQWATLIYVLLGFETESAPFQNTLGPIRQLHFGNAEIERRLIWDVA